MALGRPLSKLVVTAAEREKLELMSRRATTGQALARRARIVLGCADGLSNTVAAAREKVSRACVGQWRQRFVELRLAGLADAPRPGTPRRIDDAKVEAIITATLETKPPARTHWSCRLMAREAGISPTRVSQIWRAFGLKPHRVNSFKISTDPMFVEKVREIVGLYLSPPAGAVVLCVDEKSKCQALERSQPILPLRPGLPERATHDYVRHGTMSLFTAWEVATGRVIGHCHKRHRHQEFLAFLEKIDAGYAELPNHQQSHIVMDNYATHKTPEVQRWFARNPRYHVHFTPTGSSWIDQVERFFAKITQEPIRRGSLTSIRQLQAAIDAYIRVQNTHPKPFVWNASADAIIKKLRYSLTL